MVNKVKEVDFSSLLRRSTANLRLKVGDTVFGRIFGFLDGKVVGIFNGVPLLAQTDLPLKVGQKILARVADIKNGKYILKILQEKGTSNPQERLQEIMLSLGIKSTTANLQILKKILAYKLPIQKDFFLLAQAVAKDSYFSLAVFLRMVAFNPSLAPEIYQLLKSFSPRKKLKREAKNLKAIHLDQMKDIFSSWETHKQKVWENFSEEMKKDILVWQKAYGIDILPLKVKDGEGERENLFILKAKKENGSYVLGIEGEIGDSPFDCKLIYFKGPVKKIYVQFFSLAEELQKPFKDFTEKVITALGIQLKEIIFTEGSSWEDEEPSYVGKLPITKVDIKV